MAVKKEIVIYFLMFFILTVTLFTTLFGFLKDYDKISVSGQKTTNNSRPVNSTNYIIDVKQEDVYLLARAVYSEARGESFKGQVAVAAVVINRVKNPGFPDTVKEVIFQPWAFTAVHDGQFWLEPDADAYRAAEYALSGWDPTGEAIYYYNPAKVTSKWIYSRSVVGKIGKHVFAQ